MMESLIARLDKLENENKDLIERLDKAENENQDLREFACRLDRAIDSVEESLGWLEEDNKELKCSIYYLKKNQKY